VERQQLARDAYRALFESSGIATAVAEAVEPGDVLPMIEAYRPDAVVLFMESSGERELALMHLLPGIADRTCALIVTSEMDSALQAHVIELGARGVVLRSEPGSVLARAVEKVCAGEIWLDRARTAGLVTRLTRRHVDEDPESAKIDSLTPRERQIVALVTEGLTNRDIAERLFISEATARNHITSILDKLDVTDRFQLTVYAFRRGLVLCPQTPAMLRIAAKMAAYTRAGETSTTPRAAQQPRRNGDIR
jgi:DNA-binding NarL/FixJ family response regulator